MTTGTTGWFRPNDSADQNGDVQLSFGNHTVVLEGVRNAGWNSTQDLTNVGLHISQPHSLIVQADHV